MTKAGCVELDPWWEIADSASDPQKEKQLKEDLNEVWAEMMKQDLEATGDRMKVSEVWGLHYTTIYRKVRKLNERT